MTTPHVGILAIGTELTNGQILNRNASWISQKLFQQGLTTQAHITIPDDRQLIQQELLHLEKLSTLLFVTGGLGPTTDDFTRECISTWSGQKLEWNEAAWTWIKDRFRERNFELREFQKQQCFFPAQAQILNNPLGTAHGFYLRKKEMDVFVLPGPPREIEAVWKLHIEPWLQEKFKNLDRALVKSWDCFGVGESEVAHKAEAALVGSPFEKGYRVHLPYVEFKLFYKQSEALKAAPYFDKIEKALGSWVVARDGQDGALDLLKSFKSLKEVHIQDQVSEGYLWDRLTPGLKELGLTQKLQFSHLVDSKSQPPGRPGVLHLSLRSLADREVQIEWSLNNKKQVIRAHSPYKSILMREREKHFFSEKAILFWSSLISLC